MSGQGDGGAATAPTTGTARTNGILTHYLSWGGGSNPPLLCLHGSSGCGRVWDEVAADLARDHRVICPDLRGHGDSEKPPSGYTPFDLCADAAALIDHLGLSPCILVGLSLGSRVGTVFAAERPGDLRGLVLVDPSLDMSEAVQEEFVRGVESQPASYASLDEIVERLRSRPTSGRYRTPEALRRYAAASTVPLPDGRLAWKYDRGAVVQALRSSRLDLWPYAARIRTSTLLVRGADSHVATPASVRRMLSVIPGSRLVEVERAIHGIPQDNPAGFLAVLRPFLRQCLDAAAAAG